jgi:hypothetical protein
MAKERQHNGGLWAVTKPKIARFIASAIGVAYFGASVMDKILDCLAKAKGLGWW